MMNNKLPVWFLDIDGVINVLSDNKSELVQPHHRIWQDWEEVNIDGFPIVYSPELIAEINNLSHMINIVWLTTWREKAVSMFAPIVGLRKFPFRDASGSPFPYFATRSTQSNWWKMNAVIEDIDTIARPVVWTDDDIRSSTVGVFIKKYAAAKDVPIKTITPFATLGLEPHHLKNIKSFAITNSSD